MYTAIHASCSSRSRTVQGESTNSRPRRRVSHDISYKKCVRKCPGMRSCKIIGLKVPWNEHLQKKVGGGASRRAAARSQDNLAAPEAEKLRASVRMRQWP